MVFPPGTKKGFLNTQISLESLPGFQLSRKWFKTYLLMSFTNVGISNYIDCLYRLAYNIFRLVIPTTSQEGFWGRVATLGSIIWICSLFSDWGAQQPYAAGMRSRVTTIGEHCINTCTALFSDWGAQQPHKEGAQLATIGGHFMNMAVIFRMGSPTTSRRGSIVNSNWGAFNEYVQYFQPGEPNYLMKREYS